MQLVSSSLDYTLEEHNIWTRLYSRQIELIHGVVSDIYKQGFVKLMLDPFCIPQLESTGAHLFQCTGWKLASAQNKYLTADEWFDHLVHRYFPATNYIRDWASLDFTPYPDLFHEYFGHLPFMMDSSYAEIVQRYGVIYKLARTDQQRIEISRLWWFSMEFGLIWENGQEKIIGASLCSSYGEHKNALKPSTPHYPFDIHKVAATESSTHVYHTHYFVVDSLEHLRAIIDTYAQQEGLEA